MALYTRQLEPQDSAAGPTWPSLAGRVAAWAMGATLVVACSDSLTSDGVVVGPGASKDGYNGQLAADSAVIDTLLADGSWGLDAPETMAMADSTTATADTDASAGAGCGTCPSGQVCFDPQGGGQPACLPAADFACAPCATSATCLGGVCVPESAGKFCRIPCLLGATGSSCPSGYSCTADATGSLYCQPNGGTCTCTTANAGQTRSCGTGAGVCSGSQTCGTDGWTPCSASAASTETCNGLDDDCDGTTDDGLSGQPCSLAAGPLCQGVTVCDPAIGMACSATATSESCNGQDDDCDGSTDEDWLIDGVLASDSHCGACNQPCLSANGTSSCTVANGQAACVLQSCAPFFLALKGSCVAVAELACTVCSDDGTCGPGGSCTSGTCRPACDAAHPCPANYACADGRCQPQSGDCSCAGSVAAPPKPCTVSNAAGTCTGVQVCDPAVGWQPCSAAAAQTETCNNQDDDCDGTTDEDFQVSGKWLLTAHCGGCGKSCPTALHTTSSCSEAASGPACSLACETGWVDLDGNMGNGCECLWQGDLDEPDGVDQNCDGIDGEADNAVFVAKTGSDGNPGTMALPVASVAKAIALAAEAGKRDVYVGGGVFSGSLDLVGGISVYGGYGPGWKVRDTVQFQTAIVGQAPASGPSFGVRCAGIQGQGPKTRIDGLTILAANAKQAGQSSYGILSIGCDSRFEVAWCQVVAGDGAGGAAGSAGENGFSGLDGKAGVQARDIGHEVCLPSDYNGGGLGGTHYCGDFNVSGGQGGSAICPQMDEDSPAPLCPNKPFTQVPKFQEPGQPGKGAGGGSGGTPGADSYIDSNKGVVTACKGTVSCNTCFVPLQPRDGAPGETGLSGAPGEAGSGGVAALAGSIGPSGTWQTSTAPSGSDGQHGAGGGGGGAAGGVEVQDCAAAASQFSDIGGSGGGGGAGGCGGTGGGGGQSGGGSFALFVVAVPATSLPQLFGTTLTAGNGGAGGAGGPAGSGGNGGLGGLGGASAESESKTFCTSQGGAGGVGGDGGHGGGGGGGAGGPSVQIAVAGAPAGSAAQLLKGNLLKALGKGGNGGNGGPSIGPAGLPGQTGLSQALLEL